MVLFLDGRKKIFNKKEKIQVYFLRLTTQIVSQSRKLEVIVKKNVNTKKESRTPTCKRKAYSYAGLTGINKKVTKGKKTGI